MASVEALKMLIRQKARALGIPEHIALGLAEHESGGFDPEAVSPTGVRGLFQVTNATGSRYGQTPETRNNPEISTHAGLSYYRDLLAQTEGNHHRALRLYNGTQPGNDPLFPITVLTKAEKYRREASDTDLVNALKDRQVPAPSEGTPESSISDQDLLQALRERRGDAATNIIQEAPVTYWPFGTHTPSPAFLTLPKRDAQGRLLPEAPLEEASSPIDLYLGGKAYGAGAGLMREALGPSMRGRLGMLLGDAIPAAIGFEGAHKVQQAVGLEPGQLSEIDTRAWPPGAETLNLGLPLGMAALRSLGPAALRMTRAGRTITATDTANNAQEAAYAKQLAQDVATFRADETARRAAYDQRQATLRESYAQRQAALRGSYDEQMTAAAARQLDAERTKHAARMTSAATKFAAQTDAARADFLAAQTERQTKYRQQLSSAQQAATSHTTAVGELGSLTQAHYPLPSSKAAYEAALGEGRGAAAPVSLAQTQAALPDLLKQAVGDHPLGENLGSFGKILEDLQQHGPINMETWHQDLKRVGGYTRDANPTIRGLANQIYRLLHEDAARSAALFPETQAVYPQVQDAARRWRLEQALGDVEDMAAQSMRAVPGAGGQRAAFPAQLLTRLQLRLAKEPDFVAQLTPPIAQQLQDTLVQLNTLPSIPTGVRSLASLRTSAPSLETFTEPAPFLPEPFLPKPFLPKPFLPKPPPAEKPFPAGKPFVAQEPPIPREATIDWPGGAELGIDAALGLSAAAATGSKWGALASLLSPAESTLSHVLLSPRLQPWMRRYMQPGTGLNTERLGMLRGFVLPTSGTGEPGQ